MNMDLDALKAGFDLLRTALGLTKDVRDLLPDGPKRDAVTERLDSAERATQLAEAQVAQALGYKLCRCTFPPKIMLAIKRPDEREQHRCPACGAKSPTDQFLQPLHSSYSPRGGGSWTIK